MNFKRTVHSIYYTAKQVFKIDSWPWVPQLHEEHKDSRCWWEGEGKGQQCAVYPLCQWDEMGALASQLTCREKSSCDQEHGVSPLQFGGPKDWCHSHLIKKTNLASELLERHT